MSTKRQGIACYDKAGEDEPLFVLRAQDFLAAKVVRYWATLAAKGGGDTDPAIIREALDCASQMDAWHFHKWPGISKIASDAIPTGRNGIWEWRWHRPHEGMHI